MIKKNNHLKKQLHPIKIPEDKRKINNIKANQSNKYLLFKSFGIVVVGLIGLLNCSKKDSSLEIKMTPSAAYIVYGDATSCKETKDPSSSTGPTKDITGPLVNYVTMKIKWKKATTFVISDIRILFKGASFTDGQYKCDLIQTELDCLFGGVACSSTGTYAAGKIVPSAATKSKCQAGAEGCETELISDDNCSIRCGSIGLSDQEKPFTGSGRVVIRGYSIEDDGTQVPVKAETFVTIENAP